MSLTPDIAASIEQAVGATSQQFSLSMVTDRIYMFVSNTACWIAQGASPTASAGSGSMYVPANVVVDVLGTNGAKLAVIQDSAGGKASLTPVLRV